jgi:hypothetical protein
MNKEVMCNFASIKTEAFLAVQLNIDAEQS